MNILAGMGDSTTSRDLRTVIRQADKAHRGPAGGKEATEVLLCTRDFMRDEFLHDTERMERL